MGGADGVGVAGGGGDVVVEPLAGGLQNGAGERGVDEGCEDELDGCADAGRGARERGHRVDELGGWLWD